MFGLGSRKGSQEVKKSGRAEQMKTNQNTGAFHFPLFLASAPPRFAESKRRAARLSVQSACPRPGEAA
jgi:hypothetical protein